MEPSPHRRYPERGVKAPVIEYIRSVQALFLKLMASLLTDIQLVGHFRSLDCLRLVFTRLV